MRALGMFVVVILLACLASPASAHQTNPARLQMKEVAPGTFEVLFQLPIYGNRRLKARPMLPPVCRNSTMLERKITDTTYVEKYRMQCDPGQLPGEMIRVEGLLGTQTDVLLLLETLDGRKHTALLKPARAAYVFPAPPSLVQLSTDALAGGIGRVVRHPEILALFLVLACLPFGWRSQLWGVIAFSGAHAAGQALAQAKWMAVSPFIPSAFAALTALVPALNLARAQPSRNAGWMRPFWIAASFLGVLYGAAHPEALAPEGLSRFEQNLAFADFAMGTALGVLLGLLLMVEFRQVLLSLFRGSDQRLNRLMGYVGGTLACGLLLYQASAFAYTPAVSPAIPPELIIMAALLGMWLLGAGVQRRDWVLPLFGITLAVGLVPGLHGASFPLGTSAVFGSLFLFGMTLVFRKRMLLWLAVSVAVASMVYHGWYAGQVMRDNLSLPIANAVGAVVLAVFVFYISMCFTGYGEVDVHQKWARVIGGCAALLAVVWCIGGYRLWFAEQILTEAALGFVRLPALSLALIVATALAWPRRRRIVRNKDITVRSPVAHWALLALAFFVLPYGTIKARNPFFEPHAPKGDEARRILSLVLSNTYHAFNLEDEDELYDRLSQNVSGDLVADIYLDSRRRLTAGTRKGAEVTVKDVSVVAVGNGVEGTDVKEGFSYECKWIVTARVKHWQHVHHRQNIYSGVLTIGIDDERWKIVRLELESAERVILPPQAA